MSAHISCCGVRLPADDLTDEVDVTMATASASLAKTVTTNSTVPTDTLGTVPSNDTVVSKDTVLCSDELALDMSSQSVEIITNEESNLLDLDLEVTSDVTANASSRDLDPDTEGEFMTARFYIGESVPASPTREPTTTVNKVGGQH